MWLASKIDDLDSLVKITQNYKGTSLHKTKKQQEQDQLIACQIHQWQHLAGYE